MTDLLTEPDPEALRRELIRLFAEPKNLRHIVAAGLDGVRRQLAELRDAIEGAENGADQVVTTVAELANLVRQEQRKHAGAVAQAKKEHARADQLAAEVEQLRQAVTGAQQEGAVTGRVSRERLAAAEREIARLRGELADYQLAASEAEGAAQRDHERWLADAAYTVYNHFGTAHGTLGAYGQGGRKAIELIAGPEQLAEFDMSPRPREARRPHREGDHVRLVVEGIYRQSVLGMAVVMTDGDNGLWPVTVPPSGIVTVLGTEPKTAAKPCWCGHEPGHHVTDDSDNAVCRECAADLTVPVQRVLHVHAPEQP